MAIDTDAKRVRLLIGDTDSGAQLLADDEIAHFIAANSIVTSSGGTSVNVPAAAADAAGAISAKFAREFDFNEDTQGFRRSQKVSHYAGLERTLRNRAGGHSAKVAAGAETPT
jgi:hypothetical protein